MRDLVFAVVFVLAFSLLAYVFVIGPTMASVGF